MLKWVLQTSNYFVVTSISLIEINDELIQRFTDAAANGEVILVIEILDAGMPVDSLNLFGRTALRRAVFNNRTDVTRVLLERGADVDKLSGCYHETALHWAAINNNTEFIKLLLKHGASAKIRDSFGHTPRDHARRLSNKAAVRLLERHNK